jgi:hypothetical protein
MKMTNKNSADCVEDSPLKALRVKESLKNLGQGWLLNARGHRVRYVNEVLHGEDPLHLASIPTNSPRTSPRLVLSRRSTSISA